MDTYSRKARLAPASLVVLPLGLSVLAWAPGGLSGWGLLWALLVWSGGSTLLAEVGRDLGKKREHSLFERWGGKPTVRFLRHRESANPVLLQRRHERLSELFPGTLLPTANEERDDPFGADHVYDACGVLLRAKTRDQKRFPVLFEELCSYGFRRNLWGLKPFGIITAAAGLLAIGAKVAFDLFTQSEPTPLVAIVGILDLLLLLGWIVRFTPEWVRPTAESYAERLLEASEELTPPEP